MRPLIIKIYDEDIAHYVRVKAADETIYCKDYIIGLIKKDMEREANENDTDNR
jgi:hypothetical protein